MTKSEKEELSLTSDMDVDTDKKLVKDDSRCLQRHVKETDSKNRCTAESTLNCSCRTCEVEVSYGAEADLHKHYKLSCKKDPGHQNFIPVDQFSMEDLPSGYQNNDLLDLICAMSDLTVRISVNYASERRPKTWPNSSDPYPFCDDICRDSKRYGTGWVYEVRQCASQSDCFKCNGSSRSHINHGEICIRTAAHVVFDGQEAQHTTCHLFYDKGGIPKYCPNVVTLTKMSSTQTHTEQDWCQMKYVTCDGDLIDRLEKKLHLYRSLEYKVNLWFRDIIAKRSHAVSYSVLYREKLLCVIVSHPHGCSKQVSVGYCTKRVPFEQETCTRLTYTTPTCRGSSGAHIFLPGNLHDQHHHVHGGHCEETKTLNHSTVGVDMYYFVNYLKVIKTSESTTEMCGLCAGFNVEVPTLLVLHADSERQGPWDVEVSYGGETELHQRYDTCEKNPGHLKFIPVDQLKDHLPSQFESPEWLDLILALSDLTVRVSVKSVSEKRPQDLKFLKTFSDDEEQPDSCYRDSTRNMMLTGTGCVAKVIKYENSDEYRTCSCKECQMSQTPKTEFAHIYIRTAIQVVYDNFEAEDSTCDFFFDRGHTLDTCPGAVTLSGVSVEDVKIEERKIKNLQYLICVTHDLCLADRLTKMIKKYESLLKIIKDKIENSSDNLFYPDREPESVIIVSHSHGCSKRISVGSQESYKETYPISTCSGSAGAHVLRLNNLGLSCYVHIGKCEINRDRGHGERLLQLATLQRNNQLLHQSFSRMNLL